MPEAQAQAHAILVGWLACHPDTPRVCGGLHRGAALCGECDEPPIGAEEPSEQRDPVPAREGMSTECLGSQVTW